MTVTRKVSELPCSDNLEQSRIEPCLFTKEGFAAVIYVDDVLFTGTSNSLESFKEFLIGKYSLKLPGKRNGSAA